LPRHLRNEEVSRLLKVIHDRRDRALFMLMLRCGLRVEEVVTCPPKTSPHVKLG